MKSKFDLSHERKLSLNMGELIPILCMDVLPGDNFRVNTEVLMRFAPLLAPIMHRINVYVHYFFVPNRLVWSEWEDFITGGRTGALAPVHPFMGFPVTAAADRSVDGSLADYLGLPTYPTGTTMTNTTSVSALPFRAYQMIYNEYYRDPNLTDEVPFGIGSGAVSGADLLAITLKRKRAWEKDYFTSSMPWAQRGTAAGAPITPGAGAESTVKTYTTGAPIANATGFITDASGKLKANPGSIGARIEDTTSKVLIEEIRKAAASQNWMERNMRRGWRYVEQLLSHWGVVSSDARLQRPEYLGGGKQPVVISEVLSTFQSDPIDLPQGNMAGHGIAVGSKNGFSRRFEEHGYVFGIMSVLPRTAYQQGIPRHWTRFDKFEYPWPEFAHLGEQVVAGKEIHWDPTLPANTTPADWGYQERYAECKFFPSSNHGEMRGTLSYWNMTRIFATKPVLNESFVMADPTFRIFAVTDPNVHHLYCQLYNNVSAIRRLPFHGIPGSRV